MLLQSSATIGDAKSVTGNQGLKNLFCVPTDELLQAKDDLLSDGGQSLSSVTEQVVRQSLQPNRYSFSLLQLTKSML